MARDDWGEKLQAVITGGLQGYQQGRTTELEIRKELWKEQLKRRLNQQFIQEAMSKYGGDRTGGFRLKGLTGGGELTGEFVTPSEQAKELTTLQEFQEKEAVRPLLSRYRRYALGEKRYRPETAPERIGQLESGLITKFPTQEKTIKGGFTGLKTFDKDWILSINQAQKGLAAEGILSEEDDPEYPNLLSERANQIYSVIKKGKKGKALFKPSGKTTPSISPTTGKIRIIRTINGEKTEGTISPQYFNPKTDRKI